MSDFVDGLLSFILGWCAGCLLILFLNHHGEDEMKLKKLLDVTTTNVALKIIFEDSNEELDFKNPDLVSYGMINRQVVRIETLPDGRLVIYLEG